MTCDTVKYKMHLFTTEEYADITFVYGYSNGNAREAAREYRRRYPNRHQPAHTVFSDICIFLSCE
ncbi:hypothetical protein ABEB36_015145 [Hypothenemus hampei]|uniref:DUF4817 domain-containing protein n=1 Tax=Hypothenemus hampei TaxID=57062 RepID=A0ABD1E0U9_HYPHA